MPRTWIEYDLTRYGYRQMWALLRDLSANGWRVSLTVLPDRRPPDAPPSYCIYRCVVCNHGWNVDSPVHRSGRTPWLSLKAAVDKIITPAETAVYMPQAGRAPASPAPSERRHA